MGGNETSHFPICRLQVANKPTLQTHQTLLMGSYCTKICRRQIG